MLLKQQSVHTTPQTKPTGQNTSQEGSLNKPPGQSQSDEGSLLSLVSSYAVDCTVAASEKVQCVLLSEPAVYQDLCTCHDWPLKKPFSICQWGWKEILTPFSGYFLTPLGPEQGYLYYYLGITLCLGRRLCSYKKSWRQYLNDINDAYDHQCTLFLLNYVCTIPVFSWMINGGNNLREDDDLREAIILNISHLKSNKLNIGLFNCSKFSSLINFQSFFHHWSFLLDLNAFRPDREGIKGREDGERGGGLLFKETQ